MNSKSFYDFRNPLSAVNAFDWLPNKYDLVTLITCESRVLDMSLVTTLCLQVPLKLYNKKLLIHRKVSKKARQKVLKAGKQWPLIGHYSFDCKQHLYKRNTTLWFPAVSTIPTDQMLYSNEWRSGDLVWGQLTHNQCVASSVNSSVKRIVLILGYLSLELQHVCLIQFEKVKANSLHIECIHYTTLSWFSTLRPQKLFRTIKVLYSLCMVIASINFKWSPGI